MHDRASRLLLALLLAFPATVRAATLLDASADYENRREGAPPSRGKIYVSNGRLRTETETPTAKVALIVDPTAKKVWVLMPPPIGCITQPLTDAVTVKTPLLLPKGAKEEIVGSETIDGQPTKKYKVTTTVDGVPRVHTVWRATDLRGFPVQTADEHGKIRSTFKNIKLGKPDRKLFEPGGECKPLTIGPQRRLK